MAHLASFSNTVGGVTQTPGAVFESFDRFTGRPWALIPRTVGTPPNPVVIR